MTDLDVSGEKTSLHMSTQVMGFPRQKKVGNENFLRLQHLLQFRNSTSHLRISAIFRDFDNKCLIRLVDD